MSGCYKCGSDRLKGAPLPVVGTLAGALTRRRRYRCSGCGWAGWRHPLRRRSGAGVPLVAKRTPDRPAITFFTIFAGALVTATLMLATSCEPAAPSDTSVLNAPITPGDRASSD